MKTFTSLEESKEAFQNLKKERRAPWVYASAAMTLNGRIRGQKKPFGGPVDQLWYHYLLSQAGTIVLGATTFRGSGRGAETNYQGKQIVVFSSSLDLPLDAPAISGDDSFVIYSDNQDEKRRARVLDAGENIQIRNLGEDFNPRSLVKEIASDMTGPILVDGGGHIYTLLAAVIQDWYLTLIPRFSEVDRPGLWLDKSESPDIVPRSLFSAEKEGQERLLFRFARRGLS